METSHPKVWRYIRALTKEIGIIVLGVLLALGAGQLVELMYWSHLTRQTEHQMRGELTDASKFAFERIAFGPRLEQRLLDLGHTPGQSQRNMAGGKRNAPDA